MALRAEREIYVINEAQGTWNWCVLRLFLNKEEKGGTTEVSGEAGTLGCGLWCGHHHFYYPWWKSLVSCQPQVAGRHPTHMVLSTAHVPVFLTHSKTGDLNLCTVAESI